MLGRISRGLGHKSGGKTRTKYRFDVVIEKLDNLPSPVKKCRVVWSRGPKLQMTDIKDVSKGAVAFKQKLSQIATMYQDAKGAFEPKEYKFQVQVPGKEDNKLLTVGRAELDMSHYVLAEGTPQSKMIPMMFKVGMASTGYLKVTITAEVVASGGDSDDGMTEVSGLTGMTANLGEDQDLSGFDEDRSAQPSSGTQSGANSRPSSRMSTAATSPAKPEVKGAANKASSSPAPSKVKPAVKEAVKGDGDDEISPMSLSLASSGELPPDETNSKPARAAGKPSVVDKAAAADARAQLFGTAPSKPPKAAASSASSSSSRFDQPLSEDEARAALFATTIISSKGSTISSKRPSIPAASTSSKPATAAPDLGKAATASKAATPSPASPTSSAEPSRRPSVTASEASTALVPRRALLDRSALQDKQQAQQAAGAAEAGPSSSKQQPRTSQSTHGHSLSDSDDDDSPPQQQMPRGGSVQQASAAHASQAAAAPFSRVKQSNSQQQPVAQQATADSSNSNSAASKALASENEKLKAQLVALRQQAADAEESRRMAVLAAENAASERDEYQGQVQELQTQLKEALVSLVPAEEVEELRLELQALQQQVQTEQRRQQEQQQQHEAEVHAWQAERSQLQQKVEKAQLAAQKAQQDVDKRVQQLQADADSHAGLMRHLSWQLEAAQQALQQQQQEHDAGQQQLQEAAGSTGASGAASAHVVASVNMAPSAVRQWSTVLQFLADEVQALSQHELVHQCLTTQLLQEASSSIATLELDGALQGPVLEVLGGIRAATAAAQQHEAQHTSLTNRLASLTTALDESQAAVEELQQQASSQSSSTAANMQKLQAEVDRLQQENVQLQSLQAKLAVQQSQLDQQQQGSPRIKAAMPATMQPHSQLIGAAGPATVSSALNAECKVCVGLREQLSAAQHKTTKLTAARDKLEIILHDLETSSADEQQQLKHQLAAANKALRSSGQQLTAVQQQLAQIEQELADRQQQLDASTQQLLETQQHEAALQQQLAVAAEKLQQLEQQAAEAGSRAAPPVVVSAPAQVIAVAESAGPSGIEQALAAAQDQVADLQRQLADADGVRRGLEKELSRARKQLADEQSERNTLEEHMITRLEDMGDDVAQETVAAYEAKYNRLKSRYRELNEVHREEVDKLHDEIGTLQERVVELEAQAAQLEAAKTQAQHGEVTLADTLAKASKASSELAALRAENQMLTQNLIAFKLDLALACEREVIGRHELYKARETNLKLASKMTKLETLVYANKK